MKNILVIDENTQWCKFCLGLGCTVVKNILPDRLARTNFDLYVISEFVPANLISILRKRNKKFLIATSRPINNRRIAEAKRLGAIGYIAKDFQADVIKEKLREVLK